MRRAEKPLGGFGVIVLRERHILAYLVDADEVVGHVVLADERGDGLLAAPVIEPLVVEGVESIAIVVACAVGIGRVTVDNRVRQYVHSLVVTCRYGKSAL